MLTMLMQALQKSQLHDRMHVQTRFTTLNDGIEIDFSLEAGWTTLHHAWFGICDERRYNLTFLEADAWFTITWSVQHPLCQLLQGYEVQSETTMLIFYEKKTESIQWSYPRAFV